MKITNLKKIILIIIILLSSFTIVSVFGRYVLNNIYNSFLESKRFYFYSDKLKDTATYYQINNWSGVDPYTITINMDSRKNNILVSNYDIAYTASFSCTNGIVGSISKTSGTIPADGNSDTFTVTITPNTTLNINDQVQVTITASANSYYQKTLSATFIFIVGRENLSYEISDEVNQQYFDLKFTNTLAYYTVRQAFDTYAVNDRIDIDTYLSLDSSNKAKCYSALITVSFNPDICVLDMTNSNYINAIDVRYVTRNGTNYINQITFSMDAISSDYVRFYKLDVNQNYTYPIINNTPIVTVTSS